MWGLGVMFCWVGLVLFLFLWAVLFILIFILFNAHLGYLHFISALVRWSSSSFNSCWSEQMVLALWWRVPTTLYLDDTGCRLSQWRYWSVCVGFLYTVVCSLPSWSGFIRMSRKGKAPSGPGSSPVNWMFLSTEFRCCKNSSLWHFFMMTKVSSTNLLHNKGGFGDDSMALISNCSM